MHTAPDEPRPSVTCKIFHTRCTAAISAVKKTVPALTCKLQLCGIIPMELLCRVGTDVKRPVTDVSQSIARLRQVGHTCMRVRWRWYGEWVCSACPVAHIQRSTRVDVALYVRSTRKLHVDVYACGAHACFSTRVRL